jgi:hypothetical protein
MNSLSGGCGEFGWVNGVIAGFEDPRRIHISTATFGISTSNLVFSQA